MKLKVEIEGNEYPIEITAREIADYFSHWGHIGIIAKPGSIADRLPSFIRTDYDDPEYFRMCLARDVISLIYYKADPIYAWNRKREDA